MKTRIFRVDGAAQAFAGMIETLALAGLRCGWLDLSAAAPPPPELEAAAAAGVSRAVSAVGSRAVVVKPVRGPFVLRDLLREHFAGCDLVLVRGAVEAPLLSPPEEGTAWTIRGAGEETRLDPGDLVRRLRRPSWKPGEGDD